MSFLFQPFIPCLFLAKISPLIYLRYIYFQVLEILTIVSNFFSYFELAFTTFPFSRPLSWFLSGMLSDCYSKVILGYVLFISIVQFKWVYIDYIVKCNSCRVAFLLYLLTLDICICMFTLAVFVYTFIVSCSAYLTIGIGSLWIQRVMA